MSVYFLGYDIGSSSVKAALVDGDTNTVLATTHFPKTEMEITSPKPGWAEQDPELWWKYVVEATKEILSEVDAEVKANIKSIGISYQMHGLVLLDKNQRLLRPSIIWSDSRAIETGNDALAEIGEKKAFDRLLNTPGNFTASKFGWVRNNEPNVYDQVDKIMLPGDYINYRLTGEVNTTPSGLSEGILWDFTEGKPAHSIFDTFGIAPDMIPEVKPTFSVQGEVSREAADILGIPEGVVVGYRAGDQPNNAMSLGVNNPGEVAATGGTSGVVYGVQADKACDRLSRVNSFAHVNYTKEQPNVGVLLCINGSGSLYRWTRQITGAALSYKEMEAAASAIPIGSDGLLIHPFGNGAERMLNNKNIGAQISHIDLNRHQQGHVFRASLEGVAFSFVYGMKMLNEIDVETKQMKAGNDNLFQSDIFSSTISTLMGVEIDLIDTTGAVGAAKASGFTIGHYTSLDEAMKGIKSEKTITPDTSKSDALNEAYSTWENHLIKLLS